MTNFLKLFFFQGDGHDPDTVELDDEMARVFAQVKDKFDVSQLSADNPTPASDSKYDEKDFDCK